MARALPPRVPERIREWAGLWGTPDLARGVTIRVSTRLRTSIGRCRPHAAEIRIAAFVLDGPAPLLDEVVCHELAHVAAFQLHGPDIRAHGEEWTELMRKAGFAPRPRLAAGVLEGLPPPAQRARVRWEHRCPVCHAVRFAGRPVRQWRCAACREVGLEGKLVVARHPPRGRGA